MRINKYSLLKRQHLYQVITSLLDQHGEEMCTAIQMRYLHNNVVEVTTEIVIMPQPMEDVNDIKVSQEEDIGSVNTTGVILLSVKMVLFLVSAHQEGIATVKDMLIRSIVILTCKWIRNIANTGNNPTGIIPSHVQADMLSLVELHQEVIWMLCIKEDIIQHG